MRKNILHLLLFLAIFLNPTFVNKNNLITLFSRQSPIDPQNLHESYNPNLKTAIFNNQSVPIPPYSPLSTVLGDTNQNPSKRIEINLTAQRLYAYENDKLIFNFLISSGTWGRTPNGNFKIWTKIRSQKMSGGSRELGTYYYLPNVPYIMFFYNDSYPKQMGFSLHGTYWHNNFGVPMSHGCINMKTDEVAQLFPWAEVNTPITIYGKYQTTLPLAKR